MHMHGCAPGAPCRRRPLIVPPSVAAQFLVVRHECQETGFRGGIIRRLSAKWDAASKIGGRCHCVRRLAKPAGCQQRILARGNDPSF